MTRLAELYEGWLLVSVDGRVKATRKNKTHYEPTWESAKRWIREHGQD